MMKKARISVVIFFLSIVSMAQEKGTNQIEIGLDIGNSNQLV